MSRKGGNYQRKKMSNNNIKEYIKFSFNKSKKDYFSKEFQMNGIDVYVEEPLPKNVSIEKCLRYVFTKIPKYFLLNLNSIRVGQYDEFFERKINAFYKDGTIYVTNQQDDNFDMIDDIMHEIAHSVEELAKEEIYEDMLIEREFLGKKKRILDLLKEYGYNVIGKEYSTTKYNTEFDSFLFSDVKYPLLKNLSMGLFVSPYSLTSLREYFATGFEEYFLGDKNYLKKISPVLYSKIKSITNK
tara:strand:- start:166 stop:891 length:726 start_codon:yes stop_codon:yes gene_type:complete